MHVSTYFFSQKKPRKDELETTEIGYLQLFIYELAGGRGRLEKRFMRAALL